jgi:hypothetical protein
MKNKKKIKKGQYQYINMEKKKRIIITCIMFAVPLAILFTGIKIFGDRQNYLTIAAILLCLPAAKQMVSAIMMCMYRSISKDKYMIMEQHKGSLVMAYELVLTNYEKNTFVDAVAICGNQVVGYTSSDKADLKYIEQNTQKILRNNGYGVSVKILKDFNHFVERLDTLNENEASLRADISFKPDERYPELSREELIKHTILAISL